MRTPARPAVNRRFAACVAGASLVEFALVAPVLIILYFGGAELCQGLLAQRKSSHASAAVADLVAQDDQLSNADINDILTVSRAILSPFPDGAMNLRVSQVLVDANGNAKVDWSRGDSPLGKGATVSLPAGIANANQAVIMSEMTYQYQADFGFVLNRAFKFEDKHYFRPRRTDRVPEPA